MDYQNLLLSYCKALQASDYQAIVRLFAKNAQVVLGSAKPASEFYQNYFKLSQCAKVEIKDLFVGLHGNDIAALIYLEEVRNGEVLQVEVVDIFEFDAEYKITKLRIIVNKYYQPEY